jgi:hypothetical protein
MEFELQFEASVIDRRADFFKENFGFFTHRELADHLNNNGSLARLGELLMQLASFNKSEVCIQFALQQDEVLALAGIPIEMIANREQHIARCLVDVHKIDRIGLFDGHELLLLSPDNLHICWRNLHSSGKTGLSCAKNGAARLADLR